MPHSARSLPPFYRHSRLTIVRRGCNRCRIAGIHGEAMYTAPTLRSACSPSSCKPAMAGSRGRAPCVLLGVQGGIFSHVREYPPYPQPHTVWGKAAASSGCSPSAPCAEKERTSLSRSPLFLLIFCCAEAIIPLPASPSRQRQPSPVRRRNTARSARSASRTSRGTGSWSAGQWRSSSALPRGTRPR